MRSVTATYDVFVEAAARALSRPITGCGHLHQIVTAYACLCCPGTVRCHACHLAHLPDQCPVCGHRVNSELPVTHQIEHEFTPAAPQSDYQILIVHGEICTSCAIDNDWPQITP